MSVRTTRQDLFQLLANAFQEPPGSVTENRSRQSLPNWDSMGNLMLIAELDEKLHVTFDEEELKGLTSVADILALLREKGVEVTD